MKAIIYARVSSKEQALNYSLETQEKSARDFCERNRWSVERVFVDAGESAKTADRPQFNAAIEFCRKNKPVDFFVVYAVNRFARNTDDHVFVKAALRRFGTALRSVTEPITDTATGRLMETMLSGFAQFDNDVRADRTVAGMKAALEKGRWAWQPPLGYLEGMKVDPERAPIVRKAFELAASGDYTGPELRDRLLGLGLTGRHGRPVSRQTLYAVIRNGLYAGIVRARKWGIETEGKFEPLISAATFYQVQTVLAGNAAPKAERLRVNPLFPLRGFVRCAEHDRSLTASQSRGKLGKRYGYYRCTSPGCVNVRREGVEGEFEALLSGLSLRPGPLRLLREITVDSWKKRHAEAEERRVSVERRVRAIREKKKRLLDKLVDGTITDEAYREKLERVEAETDFGVGALIGAEVDERTMSADLAFAERVLSDLRLAWAQFGHEQRQRFQRIIFPEGLAYSKANGGFGTPTTAAVFGPLRVLEASVGALGSEAPRRANGTPARASAFKQMRDGRRAKSKLVAPTGIEPVLRPRGLGGRKAPAHDRQPCRDTAKEVQSRPIEWRPQRAPRGTRSLISLPPWGLSGGRRESTRPAPARSAA